MREMNLVAQNKSGHLRIASVPSVASRLLPDILTRFIGQDAGLHVSLFDDSSEAVLAMVKNRHGGFRHFQRLGAGKRSALHADLEGQHRRGLPPGPSAGGQEKLDWQQLRGHRLIANGTSRLLAGTSAGELIAESQIYISNMISLLAMIEAGMGITTLPPPGVSRRARRIAPFRWPRLASRDIGLVRLANRSLPVAAQALFDFILRDNGLASRN